MIRSIFVGLVLGVVFFATASHVFAQNTVFPTQLVPSSCGGAGQPECNVCDFETLLITVMRFIVAFSVVAAAGLFAWAGAKMVTAQDNAGAREEAKGIFWNVVLGLVVVLGAYLFVDTIMKTFLKNSDGSISSELGPWNDVICPENFVPQVGISNGANNGGAIGVGGTSGGTGGASLGGNSPIQGTAGCPTCVDLTQNGFTCRIQSGGACVADPKIVPELTALKSGTSDSWVITAGYQPGQHKATCQNTYGTCVDASFTDKNYSDVNRIVSFQRAASTAGCPAQFESNNSAMVNSVNSAGGNALLINYPAHFSLYCNR